MPKKALGKGLGAIFGDDSRELKKRRTIEKAVERGEKVFPSQEKDSAAIKTGEAEREAQTGAEPTVAAAGASEKVEGKEENVSRETLIRISLIEPNREQPRKKFDEASLSELAASMKKYGVLQPLLVQKRDRMYEIIAGERRWRAAKLAGLSEVPVIIKDFAKQEAAEIAIIENIQREDLNAVEEARAYQALIDEFHLTQEEVAEKVSKNRSTITNSLRLLQLSDEVLSMLSDGRISAGHARCLISLGSKEEQLILAQKIESEQLSVRETEKLVKLAGAEKKAKKEQQAEEKALDMYLIDIARKLTGSLGTKVQIKQGAKGKGKIEIDYYDTDALNQIIDKLL